MFGDCFHCLSYVSIGLSLGLCVCVLLCVCKTRPLFHGIVYGVGLVFIVRAMVWASLLAVIYGFGSVFIVLPMCFWVTFHCFVYLFVGAPCPARWWYGPPTLDKLYNSKLARQFSTSYTILDWLDNSRLSIQF